MHRDDQNEPVEYLISRVQQALADDERVNQLDLNVRLTQHEVILSGSVQTDERRLAAEAVARAVLPHHSVVNEIRVIELSGATHTPESEAVRVAAVADIHFGLDSEGQLRSCLDKIGDEADVLLLAGDLTRHGKTEEAAVLGRDLERCGVPVVAVLGNHDHHSDEQGSITAALEHYGVIVLEGKATTIEARGVTVGIAGTKGFGGGFAGACGSEFGERIQKDFIAHTRELAERLGKNLSSLDTDIRIALTHFSPVEDTLRGERLEIYPWLGSYLLAEAIDHAGCDWVFHGHAHGGTEVGTTPAGIPVRNVAQPVIGQAYKVYCIEPTDRFAGVTALNGMAG